MTKIIKNIKEPILKEIGKSIRNGDLVIFPTETVYGIGADATNEAITQSGLSLMIIEDKKIPPTIPTAPPSPEKPTEIPSGDTFSAAISDVTIVHTKVSRQVYMMVCFETLK